MAVNVTVSEALDGPAASDTLAGGGTGIDIGSIVNNSYGPVIDKAQNTGKQDLFVSHDGVNSITDVKTHIQTYGVGSGFTYGGADSAANDFTQMRTLGNASGNSKNNADQLSGGLWIDHDSDVATVNNFDFAANGIGQGGNDTIAKYGDNNTDGIDLASAFTVKAAAMVYNLAGEQQATAPVDGTIGQAGNTVLGDAAHVQLRVYLPQTFSSGGIIQFEWVVAFTFTS